jgi:hypothetical protein
VSDVPGPGQEPSEEEVRAYLSQLRGAPVEQVVAEVTSALLNAAQVKLGRRDGRLLLDLVAALVDGARGHLPADLTGQVDDVLAQLRVAQVDAEREVAAATQQGHQEPNDLGAPGPEAASGDTGRAGAGSDTPPAPPTQEPPAQQPSAASRLWVPGR